MKLYYDYTNGGTEERNELTTYTLNSEKREQNRIKILTNQIYKISTSKINTESATIMLKCMQN